MAKKVFQAVNWTPTATADTTALANGTHMTIQGNAATQRIQVSEILVSGFAGSSSPTILQWARNSTVAGTPTALAAPNSVGFEDPIATALSTVEVTCVAATTPPQRSAATTDIRLNMGLNAFGGILRWVAAPGSEWYMVGNTASGGSSSLSAFTGGTVGAISAHIIYEAF